MPKKDDCSFIVYIDESGDEGFVFPSAIGEGGSSQWFVLSAAVFAADTEPQDVKCVDVARTALGRDPKTPLHFRDLEHAQRVVYAQQVARARMQLVNVLVHKPTIPRARFSKKAWLYHWATRLVLERVSWLCHSRFNDESKPPIPGDGSASIVFSHRRKMSYSDLCDYLRLLQEREGVTIDWRVIDPDFVTSAPHKARRGLQVADVVASAFFSAVEPNRFGNRENRYARELMRKVYSGDRGPLSYGIKLYPSTAVEEFLESSDLLN
jgi:hypothetical protein